MRTIGVIVSVMSLTISGAAVAQFIPPVGPGHCVANCGGGGGGGSKSGGGGGGGHGRGLGTALGIASGVMGIIQQANPNGGQLNSGQPITGTTPRLLRQQNANTDQQAKQPARKSSEPPVPVLHDGDDRVSENGVYLFDSQNTATALGHSAWLKAHGPVSGEQVNESFAVLALLRPMAILATKDAIGDFRSQMNQTHEP